jgi:hypothetical protein
MRRFLTWAATGLLFVENCEVAHARTSLATPSSEAIDALFKRYDKETTPGCSVAVIQSGKVTFKKSYGMADPVICPLLSGPISILELATKEEWNGKEAQTGGDHR